MSARVSALASTDAALAEFAAQVGSEGPIAVEGNRTRWDLGGPLNPETRLVKAPSGIVTYTPDEMTVTVRVGTAVADLHDELAHAGQRTALPERGGTVGGALAAGENGLFVLGRGRLRTALLQVRYVSSEGEVVTGGGPTVKNVTGFDIPRLMVGSLGTLGCLAEAILRTNPTPAVSRWLRSDDADPFRVQDTVLRPSVILWNGSSTWVLLEGHGSAVDAETNGLARIGAWEATSGAPEPGRHRWSLSPGELRHLPSYGMGAFVASVGIGTIWADGPQPPWALDPGVAIVTDRLKREFDPAARLNPGRSVGPAVGAAVRAG